jgi:hypothetical protein
MAQQDGASGQLTERQQLKMLLEETDPTTAGEDADDAEGAAAACPPEARNASWRRPDLSTCAEPAKPKKRKRKQEFKVEEIVGMKVDSKTVRGEGAAFFTAVGRPLFPRLHCSEC